jgi:hypothetical protein
MNMLKHRVRRLEIRLRRGGLGADSDASQPQRQARKRKDSAKRAPPAGEQQPLDRSDEEWLELFEAMGREGNFDREPDFVVALAFYRDALRKAKEQTDPPFDPPPEFLPEMVKYPYRRLLNWRTKSSFPEVHEGRHWLMGMLCRFVDGIPPVTEGEFRELASWFHANADRLIALSSPSCRLVIGDGRTDSVSNLRYMLEKGPRSVHAGEAAEAVRQLRKRYGAA